MITVQPEVREPPAAQARREQFGMDTASGERQHAHDMDAADVGHQPALEQQASKPNGEDA